MGFELPFVIGPEYIAVALFGVVIGIIFGAIPGMTATMAVAVFLPLTYAYSMEMALYLLLGLYVGGISGGLVPAILINIPGTPSSVCTTFDGHPMALRGEGERALKIGVTSSFMGGMISLVVLALFTPILAGWAIKFSAVEKFLIILFALTVIAALSRGQMLRGLWIGMLGVLVAMMNQFSVNNEYRMVPEFLESQMQSGFQLFPVPRCSSSVRLACTPPTARMIRWRSRTTSSSAFSTTSRGRSSMCSAPPCWAPSWASCPVWAAPRPP